MRATLLLRQCAVVAEKKDRPGRRRLPDVLVADLMMPKMNGAELVWRAPARGFIMPVIFTTGYAQTEALNQAVGGKANFLTKPFLPDELAAFIGKVLLQQNGFEELRDVPVFDQQP